MGGGAKQGTVTSISAGAGLSATPDNPITTSGTLAVDTSAIQSRVSGSCSAGNAIRVINSNGSVTCQATGGSVSLTEGTGIALTPNTITGTGSIAIDTSVVPLLSSANSFTQNQSIAGNLTISGGNINLPATSSSSVGVINLGMDQYSNPKPFIHNYGTNTGCCVVGNTFVGEFAGNFTTSSSSVNGNTGIGYAALTDISTGTSNTGVGYLALGRNTTGFSNSALGLQALWLNTNGYNNIAIGYAAGAALGSESNHDDIDIGTGVGAVENNTIRIGDSNQTSTFIAGINGTTASGGVAVYVNANGQLGTLTSSRRFKFDIHDMDDATRNLLRLRPVTFRYKQAQSDGEHPLQYGLIAEEVAEVYPELVQNSPEGKPNAVFYQYLPAMLLNEFQKQHGQIEAQQKQIQSLQEQLQQLADQTRQLQTELVALRARGERANEVAVLHPRP